MQKIGKCFECGGQFVMNKSGPRKRFCCTACRLRYNSRENRHKKEAAQKADGVKSESKNAALEAKIKAASDAGMSYGKYVAMQHMQQMHESGESLKN